MRLLIALLLRESLDREHPGWQRRLIQRKAVRKEEAYADHHIARGLVPPLRKEQRR